MNSPVLFIPGTLCTPAVFKTQIKALTPLSSHISCAEFSHEDSISKMADRAIQFIRGQTPVAVVGFSMGGMVAMEMTRRAPELIEKLALVISNADADHGDRRPERALHLAQARSKGMESVIKKHYLGRYLHQHSSNIEGQIVQMACQQDVDCFAAQIEALSNRVDSRRTLENLDCPTLILGAKQDQLCPPSKQRQMFHLVKNSELVMLDNCGHFSTLERPDEVNKALRNWYLGTPAAV